MNNYPNFKNYNNYVNSNMNNNIDSLMNIYNNQMNTSDIKYKVSNINTLYEPYDGFIRGNLFKNLYDPYKLNEPYEIKPMNEQAELLTYIDALGFSMTDLTLYLDIYPDDQNLINLFNQFRKERQNLVKEYESKYGPITLNSDSLNSYPWVWDNMPWPWDN